MGVKGCVGTLQLYSVLHSKNKRAVHWPKSAAGQQALLTSLYKELFHSKDHTPCKLACCRFDGAVGHDKGIVLIAWGSCVEWGCTRAGTPCMGHMAPEGGLTARRATFVLLTARFGQWEQHGCFKVITSVTGG